jgi:hypothetical protein
MGRQIQFYMLPEDTEQFMKHVQASAPVVVTEFNSEIPDVRRHQMDAAKKEMLCLWNQALLPHMERKFVPESERGSYYRVEYGAPILELSTSLETRWNGMPALLQGRVYGAFETNDPRHRKWFNSIVRWIRRNYTSNPIRLLGGYLGPRALEWFNGGGVLLPMFMPPDTPEWRAVIETEHGITVKQAS